MDLSKTLRRSSEKERVRGEVSEGKTNYKEK